MQFGYLSNQEMKPGHCSQKGMLLARRRRSHSFLSSDSNSQDCPRSYAARRLLDAYNRFLVRGPRTPDFIGKWIQDTLTPKGSEPSILRPSHLWSWQSVSTRAHEQCRKFPKDSFMVQGQGYFSFSFVFFPASFSKPSTFTKAPEVRTPVRLVRRAYTRSCLTCP